MTKRLKILGLALLCFYLQGCTSHAFINTATNDANEAQKTQVIIIGTIHKKHNKNPKYSPETLRDIIFSLKPNAILNELPLSLVDKSGRPKNRSREHSPENWAADTVAKKLGIKQIPFDRPDRQKNFRKTKYFKKQKRAKKLKEEWREQLKKENPNCIDLKIATIWDYTATAEMHQSFRSHPEIINSSAHDAIIRSKKLLWYDIFPNHILPKYPEYEELIELYHFARDQWNERNKIMANNIIKAAKEYYGKRIVVVTGATHRYILRDLLKEEKSIELKEYWQINNQK